MQLVWHLNGTWTLKNLFLNLASRKCLAKGYSNILWSNFSDEEFSKIEKKEFLDNSLVQKKIGLLKKLHNQNFGQDVLSCLMECMMFDWQRSSQTSGARKFLKYIFLYVTIFTFFCLTSFVSFLFFFFAKTSVFCNYFYQMLLWIFHVNLFIYFQVVATWKAKKNFVAANNIHEMKSFWLYK